MPEKHEDRGCFLCQLPCKTKCDFCNSVYFCSEAHYKLHRVALSQSPEEPPEEVCLPFKTENRAGIGRVLIATRTIKPMELILVDPGTITGPNYTSRPVCLECLRPVNGEYYCARCEYPMCDETCGSGSNHAKECEIIARCKTSERPSTLRIDHEKFEKPTNAYATITPLRLLLLEEKNGDEWRRSNQLMDHHNDRISNQEEWLWYEKYLVNYFTSNLGLAGRFTSNQIHRAIGLINVNAVALKFPMNSSANNPEGKGLYPIFAIGSHYCICNARYTLDTDTRQMYVRARALIRLGDEISVQYLSALYGNMKRRRKIREEWYFDCTCRRCSDPTEMGSYISAIKCPNCGCGSVLPLEPLDYNSRWVCGDNEASKGCGHIMSNEAVSKIVDELEEELDEICSSGEFKLYSQFIDLYSDTLLHPNHYLIMTAARNLIQWYTYKNGSISDDELRKKVSLCRRLDFVLGRIDPGYSEIRSFIQKELHFGTLVLTQRDLEFGLVDRETYLEVTRISMKALDELERCKNKIKFNCVVLSS